MPGFSTSVIPGPVTRLVQEGRSIVLAQASDRNPESHFLLSLKNKWDSGSIFFRPVQYTPIARQSEGERKSSGMTVLVFWLILLQLLYSSAAFAIVPTVEKPIAVLRALDKVTARVEELEVPIGRPYKFGTLIIIVRGCRVTPPEDQPEAAAFLEIGEFKPGTTETPVFRGWMFASSPALSALEHPVYDIWVTGCRDAAPAATAPAK